VCVRSCATVSYERDEEIAMVKMLNFFRKKNHTSEQTIDLLIDTPVYEQLIKRARADDVSESEALLRALRQGMRDYWLHVAKREKERYYLVEELFKQSKRDSEMLNALIKQNERLHEILSGKEKQEGIQ
jgi:thymidylate kinase